MSAQMQLWQNYIGGAWVSEPETMPAINPASGETIGLLPRSSRATAQLAIAAARAAQRGGAATSSWKRAEMCVAIAATIDERRNEIARVLSQEQGKPLAE